MSMEIIEELVLKKANLEQQNQQLLAVLGAAVMSKNGETELRISQAALNKTVDKNIEVAGLKKGGVVITVRDLE